MVEANSQVQKDKEETAENEIRVAVAGKVSSYLGYAFRILNKSEHRSLTIRATGNAIVKALILIELVKRRIGDLHQLNTIHSMTIEDEYKPKVEGQAEEIINQVKSVRRVTALDCELSKDPLDSTKVGYQEPVPKEERVQLPPRKRDGKAGNTAKQSKVYNKEEMKESAEKGASTHKHDKETHQKGNQSRHAKRAGKRYNEESTTKQEEKQEEKSKPTKSEARAAPESSVADKDKSGPPRGEPRGRRGKDPRAGGPTTGRGRGTRGGMAKRYNDDFDLQPSKRPREHLDRPHHSRDPRDQHNINEHPHRAQNEPPFNAHPPRGMMRGMRGVRGRPIDSHQGQPGQRRDHEEREQGPPHHKHHFNEGPAIIEPMIYRGGGRGMRGGGRGAPLDRPPMKSRDDFNVAPRYYPNKDDLRSGGPPHGGPPNGGFYNEHDYYRSMQGERIARKRDFDPHHHFYMRDGPHQRGGFRGGHRGGEWDFYHQPRYGGYDQYGGGRHGKPGPRHEGEEENMRYNGMGPDSDNYRHQPVRYQGEEVRYGDRPPMGMRGGRGGMFPIDMHGREERDERAREEFDESSRGGRLERGGPMRGRRGGPGQAGAPYGSNRYGSGNGTGNNNNDEDKPQFNNRGGDRDIENRIESGDLRIIEAGSRARGMPSRGNMRMRGGARDEFRGDFRGGAEMRGMRGMRGSRGGEFRPPAIEGREEEMENPQIISGPPRGMRGRGDFGGRGRGGQGHRYNDNV